MSSIALELYAEVVKYSQHLEDLLLRNTLIGEEKLKDIRKQYIRPATNVAEKSSEYEVKDFIFGDSENVEQVLRELKERADKYEFVSVADYYELIGEPCPIEAHLYGWKKSDIISIKIRTVSGRSSYNPTKYYSIKFPPVGVV